MKETLKGFVKGGAIMIDIVIIVLTYSMIMAIIRVVKKNTTPKG